VRGGAIGERTLAVGSSDAVHVRIGRAAGELVQDRETVFLGPGRLTLEAARALAGRERLTVVTNSLEVAVEVAERTSHTLILTGGQLERGKRGLGGHLAQAALEGLRADRVILELSGVSAVEGLTDDNLPQAELARTLLNSSTKVAVLVAPQRVGRVAAAYIAPGAEADAVVTAREADSAPLWDLTESGVKVLLA